MQRRIHAGVALDDMRQGRQLVVSIGAGDGDLHDAIALGAASLSAGADIRHPHAASAICAVEANHGSLLRQLDRFFQIRVGPVQECVAAQDRNERRFRRLGQLPGRFVTIGGEPFLLRYNSRLPIVVYVPEGVEVRYRIWSAGAETKVMEKG